MGYTHYWEHGPIDGDTWTRLMRATRLIIRNRDGIKLAGPMGTGRPEVTDDIIAFNGSEIDGDDYETFALYPEAISREFCKTGARPYDTIVCAVLWYAHTRIDGFTVTSDGDMNGDDWADGRDLCTRALAGRVGV